MTRVDQCEAGIGALRQEIVMPSINRWANVAPIGGSMIRSGIVRWQGDPVEMSTVSMSSSHAGQRVSALRREWISIRAGLALLQGHVTSLAWLRYAPRAARSVPRHAH